MGIVNREGALYAATGIDNTGLYSGRREALGIIKAMAGEITSFDVFGGIGLSAAVAFAQAAKGAYDFEKEFQKNMLEVATISTQVSGSMTDFMNQVLSITKVIPVKAPEAAKALYQIVSAGHDGAAGMKVLEVAAKAAIGGVTETATAADAITTLINAYKMSADDAGKVSDQLFTTARLGKTTFGELGQSIAQVAPIAAAYGVEMDQVLAAVATLTKSGTPTAQAMTQIRAAIIGVSKYLGDGAFNTMTFQEALDLVAKKANGSEDALRSMITEVEGVTGLLGLTGINANAAAGDLDEMNRSAGATEAAFKKMSESADAQLQLLSNNITAALRPMGEVILKEISDIASAFNTAFSNGDIQESMKNLGALIVTVTGALVGYKGSIIATTAAKTLSVAVTNWLVKAKTAEAVRIVLSGQAYAAEAAIIAKNTGAHVLLTNALKAQFAAMLKNTAAMLTNPYVLAGIAVAALGYGIYYYCTQLSTAEIAQKRFNDSLEAQKRQLDELKSKTEELTGVIRSETSTQYDKEKALDSLQKMMPTIFKNMDIEKLKLMDILSLNKQIAEEINRRERIGAKTNLVLKTNAYNEAKSVYDNTSSKNSKVLTRYAKVLSSREDMILAQKQVENILNIQKKAEESLKPKELKIVSLQSNIDTLKAEIAEMQLLVDKEKEKAGGWSPTSAILDAKKWQLSTKQKAMNALIGGNTGVFKENKTLKQLLVDIDASKSKIKELQDQANKGLISSDKIKEEQDALAKLTSDYRNRTGKEYGSTKESTATDNLREQQEKLKLLTDKQAFDQARSSEDLQTRVAQSRIDAMKDGSVKTLEQMQLNHKIEMQQFEREKEDKLRKAIEDARAIFDAEEDAKKANNPKHIKGTFDASGIKLSDTDTKKYGEQKMYLDLKQSGETQALLDRDRQAWNEYLAEYGSFQERKEAITTQYNEKIAKASTGGEKASLKKELENKQKDLNLEKIKSSINFADIFGDLDTQSTESIKILRDKLKEIINKSAKDLKPTDLKALQDAFKDIDLKVSERNPFGELKQGINDYKESAKSVIEAQENLNTVQKGGEVIIGEYTDETGKLCKKLLTQSQAERNLSDAQKGRKESQIKLTESVNSIGEKGQQLVTAGSDITNMLTSLGVSIPESISGALDGIGQVMDSMASIDFMKPMSIITGITGTLAGLGKAIGSLFGGNGDKAAKDTARLEDVTNRIAESEKIINGLIEKRIELIKEATIAEQKNLSATTQAAIDNQKKYYEQQLDGLSGNWLLAKSGKNNNLTLEDLGIGSIEELEEFLSSDKLLELQKNGYGIRDAEQWRSIIDGYNSLIDKEEELQDVVSKNLTGMTLDDAKNSLDDFVRDADTSLSDVADSFEDHMRDAMLNLVKQNVLNKALEKWYEDFADAVDSGGGLDDTEVKNLQQGYESAFTSAQEAYNNMLKATGISAESDPTREASKKGIANASQDSVDENNGRLTVIQGHTYSINEKLTEITNFGRVIMSDCAHLPRLEDIGNNLRTLTASQDVVIGHLSNIEKNTARLEAIESTMVTMNKGIQDMNTKGLTLKR